VAFKSTHATKKKAAKRTFPHRKTVHYIAASLAELPPEALRTLADVVQDLLKRYETSNGEDWIDEEFHQLAGKIAGKNVPTLQQVHRSLAKIPGSLTADFIAERGER
jgi:hypothetical protein